MISHPRHFDSILVGGGAAGLCLAYCLSQACPDRSLLIVDPQVKPANDHVWCYWSKEPSDIDGLAYHTWDKLAVLDCNEAITVSLAPYRYYMVRTTDFYRFTHTALMARPNVTFLLGAVKDIVDGRPYSRKASAGDDHTCAKVVVNGVAYTGNWVFDSRYQADAYRPLNGRHHYLMQHFLGWEIETEESILDPSTPYMFDFRTPQAGNMRFLYVLPQSPTRGLVEYTVFSGDLLRSEGYRQPLQTYIRHTLGAARYRILGEEGGLIPMTDHPYPRRTGHRILNIGNRGGRIKPSSGYAFHRILQDAAAISRSLATRGHPFDLPESPHRYRTFDAMLLQILHHRGHLGAPIFMQLFRKNPIQRIFRFLDEEDNLWENLKVMASVPPTPFVRAWLHNVLR